MGRKEIKDNQKEESKTDKVERKRKKEGEVYKRKRDKQKKESKTERKEQMKKKKWKPNDR